ncbi:ketopantoate reductase PanE/ApbA C terminal-domain-containing protein [Blyttiomyces helicus]|uniref:Ketopantoate reductase PanE/ApbA C terminal-domain-containing protein n=1 Tax=Blyttiomyces helicus TaxID=388810 RepID=A0A4P9W1I8_9FUNG|nr:ketopantoate reductase PanE/ApbA C terminal-domain-containing protein [Blyttiomyces helicus]|eukprot:RKO85215.1 ketopantoate reductase PanE/ApbA C terminal-domain-containing protein [Blyttiomyces helicus]
MGICRIEIPHRFPSKIVHYGNHRLRLGPYTQATSIPTSIPPALEDLASFLRQGGCDAEAVLDMQPMRWFKLLWNGSFSPVSVLAGQATAGAMLRDAPVRELVRAMMDEIWAAGEAVLGRKFPESVGTVDGLMDATARVGEYRASMLIDWEEGRAMEVDVLLARPIAMAKAAGVAMPRLETVYALIRLAEERRFAALATKIAHVEHKVEGERKVEGGDKRCGWSHPGISSHNEAAPDPSRAVGPL